MNLEDPFRKREVCAALLEEIHRISAVIARPIRIMEVCGTHTVSIFRHGIRSLLPQNITLLSGPGCPVCVTPAGHIDLCVQAARRPGVILATFGDLLRVPGSDGSLADARGRGEAQVEVVYSPMDALELARKRPESQIVFPGIGFETTAPTVAATILAAEQQGIENFFVIPLAKTMPAVLMQLLGDAGLQLSGLLCPGHVSAIIGAASYQPLVDRYKIGCAVAGFEPADILASLLALLQQELSGEKRVENCYLRVVTEQGNSRAQNLLGRVFCAVPGEWRGLGRIAGSGLALQSRYAPFDAIRRLQLSASGAADPPGCRCGLVLKGTVQPPECPLFGRTCTPVSPVGPCMVSTEGTCAAYYRYSDRQSEHDETRAAHAL